MNDDTGGIKSVTPPLLTPEMALDVLHILDNWPNNPPMEPASNPRYCRLALVALVEGRTVCVPKDSVVVEADSNAVPSTLSVPRSSPK